MKKNRNVFCAFACVHQSKRQESLWTSRTADKNNLRIHQTTCISSTDNRMDRCQTVKNSCILTLGRSYYISIRVSRLFVYSSGKFVAVRWSAWKPKVMASTFLIPQKRWCNMQGYSMKTHLNWFTKHTLWSRVSDYPNAACWPQHVLNEKISHLSRCFKSPQTTHCGLHAHRKLDSISTHH